MEKFNETRRYVLIEIECYQKIDIGMCIVIRCQRSYKFEQ
jgi:hypothetical protein